MRQLTKLSLFSGILGDDLASEWVGIKTVCCVEIDPFCQRVIRKHYPGMPIIGDIKDATREKVKEISGYERVDIVAGGDPCQPTSIAGRRRGEADDRYLWPEMLRVIQEFKPAWVVNENPTGIAHLVKPEGDAEVGGEEDEEDSGVPDEELVYSEHRCRDLEEIGYEVQPFVVPASAVNAPHRRDRIFIVAHSRTAGAGRVGRETADEGGLPSKDRGEGVRQGDREVGTGGADPANQYGVTADPRQLRRRRRGDGNTKGGQGTLQAERPDSDATHPKGRRLRAGAKFPLEASKDGGLDIERCNNDDATDSQSPTDRVDEAKQKGRGDNSGQIKRDASHANTKGELQQKRDIPESWGRRGYKSWQANWVEVATALCGMDDGLPDRVARLKALGNACVPQQVFPIYQAIAEIENSRAETGE